MKNLRELWMAKTARERKLLSFALIFVVCSALYVFLWQPAEKARTALQQSLPQMRAEAARMREQALEIGKLKKGIPQTASTDLKTDIALSASRHHISVTAIDVDGEGHARTVVDKIPFDDWIVWLEKLQQENHLHLEAVKIDSLADAGMVRIEAKLAPWGTP